MFCPPLDARRSHRAGEDNVARPVAHAGVDLIALPDTYGRASRRRIAEHVGSRSTIRDVLVQYVPTAYGLKGANVPWCRWLLDLSRRRTDVRVMFHEPYFDLRLETTASGTALVRPAKDGAHPPPGR